MNLDHSVCRDLSPPGVMVYGRTREEAISQKESKLLTVVKPHGGQKCCAMVDVKKVLEFLKKD